MIARKDINNINPLKVFPWTDNTFVDAKGRGIICVNVLIDGYEFHSNKELTDYLIFTDHCKVEYIFTYDDGRKLKIPVNKKTFSGRKDHILNSVIFDLDLLGRLSNAIDFPLDDNSFDKRINHKNIFMKHIRKLMVFFKICREKIIGIDRWSIYVAPFKIEPEEIYNNFFKFKKITHPKDSFIADPFLVEKDNRTYVFYEKYSFNKGKGIIVARDITDINFPSKEILILEEKYHLSYPNVFIHNDIYFMIPQSSNGCIDLYKCNNFPSVWEKVHTFIKREDIEFGDTNIYITNEGIITLETNIYDHPWKSNSNRLSVTVGNYLYEKVKLDDFVIVSLGDDCSRNAGQSQRKIYQNSLNTYGGSIVANVNKEISDIKKPRGYSGMHTYNASENFTIIDLKS
ncbi:glucosamine inositolphosphorylceramide transferase family protein [Pectobacterium versatile]|uniref:glucosamine inositolphosphorylceramide transferase family protein n=1 Tax=Pectobacterium versatile TaxID=2488639 RepID=UPI000F64FB18|nr:hypothetical protein [Pectobacterium versatile]AZK62170.1 hypothetical protein EIP93_07565 [Pectobacterium versatile]